MLGIVTAAKAQLEVRVRTLDAVAYAPTTPSPADSTIRRTTFHHGAAVSPARVAIEGPPWAEIQLRELQTSPEVCSPVEPELGFFERLQAQTPAFGSGAAARALMVAVLVVAS